MRTDVYESLITQAENHWWFQARERILLGFLEARAGEVFPPSKDGEILDVGAGSGRFASAMRGFGQVSALEGAPGLLKVLREIPDLTVIPGFLPNESLPRAHFHLVTAFDVLEHIEDDRSAAREIFHLLRPGGFAMVTVPTHPFLWSDHDLVHHHFRRYVPREVGALLASVGFEVRFETPFQCYLFPLLLGERTLRRILRRKETEDLRLDPPPKPMNDLLRWIFSREAGRVARGKTLPLGSSHLAFARRPTASRR